MASSVVHITQNDEIEPLISKSYNILLTESCQEERLPLLPFAVTSDRRTTLNSSLKAIPINSHSRQKSYTLPTPDPPPPSRLTKKRFSSLLGPFLVILSAITFAGNAFMMRLSSSVLKIPTLASSFLVFSVTFIISVLYNIVLRPKNPFTSFSSLSSSDISSRDLQRKMFLLTLRGIAGALASAACYKSYEYLPVGDSVAIYNVCPSFTTLLALLVLHERVGIVDVISIFVSLSGAFLVAQPSGGSLTGGRELGALYALGDACFSAIAYTTVRFLGGSVHFSWSVGSVGLAGAIVSGFLGGFGEMIRVVQDGIGFIAIFAVFIAAVLLFVAQSLLDRGLHYCPAGRAMLLRTLEVPFAYILGMSFLGEIPDATRVLGSVLVVMAASVVAVGSKRS